VNEAGSVLIKFEADTAKFRAELAKVSGSMEGVREDTRKTTQTLTGFRNIMVGLVGIQAARSIGSLALQLDSLEKGFRFAMGSAEAAGQELAYVRQVADQLGVEFVSTAQQYAGLAAAAKGTALEGQKVRDIFYGITAAASAMGKSSADTAGILNAVQQMMSKGTVSAEELRGQMGERMWGAFQQAAQAIGLTTKELGKQLELGNVMADQMLPLLADRMLDLAEAAGTGTGAQAALNRLSNAWVDLQQKFFESGGTEMATGLMEELTRQMREWTTVAPSVINLANEINETLRALTGGGILDFFPKLTEVTLGAAIAFEQLATSIRTWRESWANDAAETFSRSVQVKIPKGALDGPRDGVPRVAMDRSVLATEEVATGTKPRAGAGVRRDVLGLLDKSGEQQAKRAKEAAKDAERHARAVEELTFELSKYAMTVERAAFEEDLRNNLQSAGAAIDSARGEEIALLTSKIWANKEAIEAQDLAQKDAAESARLMKERQQEWGDIAKTTIQDVIQNFNDLNQVFASLLSRIADAALEWGFSGGSGGGAIGSLLSDVLGSSGGSGGGSTGGIGSFIDDILGVSPRAGGGPVNRGQPYMVGEHGPELFVPSGSGSIKANGTGGGQTISVVQNFTFEGVNQATAMMLRAEAGRIADQVRREIAPTMINAQRRNQLGGAF
jgi:tape measure domain-containing protein